MTKSDAWENSLLLLLFNNTNVANVGDATGLRGSTTAGSLYLALHTADPGDTGTQSTSELAYTGYARQAVARASGAGGWTVSTNTANLSTNTDFPAMSAGAGGTVTHFSVGVAVSGATVVLYKGAVTPNLVVANGVTPRLTTATQISED